MRASASEQEVLPSAALGLIEKPFGRVTVVARSLRGRGRGRALVLGNPEVDVEARGESVAVVVGWAKRLGLKLS